MTRFGWKLLLKAALLTILIVALFSATAVASNNLTIHFLDVGQGDSELIQIDNKNVLIDGGEQDMGPRVEAYLRDHGVSSLDIVVATHPHSDHIGGLITVLNDIPIKQVLDIGQAHPSPIYETFLTLINQKNNPYRNPQPGQTIDLDPNLKIEVLNPPRIEGKLAVLLIGDDGSIKLNVPLILLPEGAKEGDILDININKDEKETEGAKKRVTSLIEDLKSKNK